MSAIGFLREHVSNFSPINLGSTAISNLTASYDKLWKNLEDDPYYLVPTPLQQLSSYPGYKLGLFPNNVHGALTMTITAVRIALAAVVLFKILPAYTGAWTLALSVGLVVSVPTTALVVGSLLLHASIAPFAAAFMLSKVSFATASLVAKGTVLGLAGYNVINHFDSHSLVNAFPSLLEKCFIYPLGRAWNAYQWKEASSGH